MGKPTPTPDGFHSKASRRECMQTLSVVEPYLRTGDAVLDVGCGPAYVAWQLAQRHQGTVFAVDIVDCRKRPTPHFELYDGVHLPFADRSCDVVVVSFMLHHVPNVDKPAVLREIRRVARGAVIVLEDTPRNFIDRHYNRRHGEDFRRSIGSTADFGFYTEVEWTALFGAQGFAVRESRAIGRFTRDWRQPFARSYFVLDPMTTAASLAATG